MTINSKKNLLYILPLIWFIINLFQGYFTSISNDEAYYWVYAQNMDWGYFDHPPMIAWMIGLGYNIFSNELGVRLFTIILSSVSLFLLFKINKGKQIWLLFLLFTSISITQIYSFVAVPDSPMLFFTVLFFYLYQKYLEKENYLLAILIGISIALLLYSKYHGILIVFFTLLSNLKLLKKKSFYVIVITALIMYFPHVYWQIINDYPSYKFHVLSKSHDPYRPLDSLLYLLGQLVVFGPLVGFFVFNYLWKYKNETQFEKTLKYIIFGFILFFLVSTLNSHGELNWTGAAVIPAIIISHRYLKNINSKWFKRIAVLSIIIFSVARLHLAKSLLPISTNKGSEFHNGKIWADQIHEKAGNLPVVFSNSYQNASKYAFYTGEISHSMNSSRYRRNQYDLWDIEDSLQGKEVFIITNSPNDKLDKLTTISKTYYTFIDPNYHSFSKIKLEIEEEKIITKTSSVFPLKIKMSNVYENPVNFSEISYPIFLRYEILKNGKLISSTDVLPLNDLTLEREKQLEIEIKSPEEPAKYYIKLVLFTQKHGTFINSRFIPFIVE